MKNPRAFLFALVVALVATFAQCRYVHQREQDLLFETAPLMTLVAKRDILKDVKLDEDMVELIEVPRRWQQPKALVSTEMIRGQISSVPILAGEQIVATKLVTAEQAGLALYVQKGLRAISLDVSVFNAVGGHIRPGNHVDILGTFDFGNGEKSDMRTITVMQDVWVLSVVDDIGRITTRDIVTMPAEGQPIVQEDPAPSEILSGSATITVAVRPAEAQKLVLAQQIGDLTVSLRSMWEAGDPVPLDHATVASTLGIVQQVRYRSGPRYRVIEGGGY
ncbi:MAG: Flp pilus assembly protein CpaB [Pseudomonadota bacterium]|nr:Flp pilus assembly protein CpaB [Pseudomonadota bacterium]